MFDKLWQNIDQLGEMLKEQVSSLGEAAKEKGAQLIDSWISILPKLEAYGFKATYFGFSVSINPTLDMELQCPVETFPPGRIQAILEENKSSTPVHLVFTAIKSAVLLQERSRVKIQDPLTVKITVRLSPEIRVSFGRPLLLRD